MTVLLGGRVAEAVVFGAITTGASDDLKKVAEIARSMVHEYAMGTGLNSQRMAMSAGDEPSDMTRNMRDQEQRDLADEAYRRSVALVRGHRDKLDELASTLLANEVLERKDIDKIMAGIQPMPERSPLPDVRLVATRDPEADK